MGKRSDFDRVEKDFYRTIDKRAVEALRRHIGGIKTYAELCSGNGDLIEGIAMATGSKCTVSNDISDLGGVDSLSLTAQDVIGCDAIITNPPWSRPILHQMIMHFKDLLPTWLLFDADWAHTKQAIPYLKYCTDIVSVGRLIWIEGTTMTGKDNCAWYRFEKEESKQIIFHPKRT